jgi:Flp pilus assembly secretin CpaC
MPLHRLLAGCVLGLCLTLTASAQTDTPRTLMVTPGRLIIHEEEEELLGIPDEQPQPIRQVSVSAGPSPSARPTVQRLRKIADEVERMGLREETTELRQLAARIEQALSEQIAAKEQRLHALENEVQVLRRELNALRGDSNSTKAQVQVQLIEIAKDELQALPIEWQHHFRESVEVLKAGQTDQPESKHVMRTRPDIAGCGLANRAVLAHEIKRLQDEKTVRILCEPTLVTVAGRPAQFHSGGEFPILVPSAADPARIEFRQFGEKLEVVPQLLHDGRWELDIALEHSERDVTNSVTAGELVVPGLTSKNINLRVELAEGQSIVQSMPMDQTIDTKSGDASKPLGKQPQQETCLVAVISVESIDQSTALNPLATH